MVRRVDPGPFTPEVLGETGFNIHPRSSEAAGRLIVLVHGVNGDPYETWGDFPKFLLEHPTLDADVGTFSYRSGLKRLRRRGKRVDAYVRSLAHELRELGTGAYDAIYLVGHSMGGIVAGLAADEYLTQLPGETVTPLGGLVMMCTPRAGSEWSFPLFRKLSKDARVVAINSPEAHKLNSFLTRDSIEVRVKGEVFDGATYFPVFACAALEDAVVTEFSAAFGLPKHQSGKSFQVNHREVAKPASADSEQVAWLCATIAEIDEGRQGTREKATRKRPLPQMRRSNGAIVTEFSSGPAKSSWSASYQSAVSSVLDADILVIDRDELEERPEPDLLVTVADASDVLSTNEAHNARIEMALARLAATPSMWVGLSPVGERFLAAELHAKAAIAGKVVDAKVWVDGVADEQELGTVIEKWIQILVSRHKTRRNPLDIPGTTSSESFLN